MHLSQSEHTRQQEEYSNLRHNPIHIEEQNLKLIQVYNVQSTIIHFYSK